MQCECVELVSVRSVMSVVEQLRTEFVQEYVDAVLVCVVEPHTVIVFVVEPEVGNQAR